MLQQRLQAREDAGRPVRVGVIGAGRFGTMVICTLAAMRGTRPSVVADIDRARGMQAFAHAGFAQDAVVRAETAAQVDAALASGTPGRSPRIPRRSSRAGSRSSSRPRGFRRSPCATRRKRSATGSMS